MYTKGSGFLRAKQPPNTPNPREPRASSAEHGVVMSKTKVGGVILLVFLICCAGGGVWFFTGDAGVTVASEPAAPGEDRLVQTCGLPPEAAFTWFDSEGVLHWTPDAIASDGSMTVRFCDDETARAVRVTGLWAGKARDWQEGAMVDRARRVVHVKDLLTLSADRPVPAARLEGVTLQCVPPMGSCEPNDVNGILAAVAAGTSANSVGGGGSTP